MLQRLGLDGFLMLPLTNEDIEVSKEFKDALDTAMKIDLNFEYKYPYPEEI